MFNTVSELTDPEKKLIDAARSASEKAYAPYSGFQVGAAVLLENGEIITGQQPGKCCLSIRTMRRTGRPFLCKCKIS